jgi:hypothetical protein
LNDIAVSRYVLSNRTIAIDMPGRQAKILCADDLNDLLLFAISANKNAVCASSGEILPPLGLGAMLPVACRRCTHLIAELGLTSNQSAASRRDAPDSTASTTRSRNSKEHGLGIDPPSRIRINAARFNYPSLSGNPDSTQPKYALALALWSAWPAEAIGFALIPAASR